MGSVSEAITGAVSASPRPRLRDWLLGSAAPRRTRERSDPPGQCAGARCACCARAARPAGEIGRAHV